MSGDRGGNALGCALWIATFWALIAVVVFWGPILAWLGWP